MGATELDDPALRRTSRHTALGLATVTMVVYALTLMPTVPGGDSGELISAACDLGVAHPPGYPLFTMLAKAFSTIPVGSVAWRVNLLSAMCNAGAGVLLLLAVARWSRNAWAGLLAGGLFVFSPLVWRYALGAEVFGLNNLFAAACLYLLVRYLQERSRRVAYVSAFVVGLGLTNHHTLVFLGMPFSFLVLWIGRSDLLRPRPFLTMVGLFAAGLLPYLYMPIASAAVPWATWGDQTSVQGFLDHFLRREYGTFKLGAETFGESGALGARLGLYYSFLPAEVLYVGTLLIPVGVFAGWRAGGTTRTVLLVSAIGYATYVVVFHYLANLPIDSALHVGIQARFWQMANLILIAWIGMGYAFLTRRLPVAPVAATAAAVVGVQVALHYTERDESTNQTFRDYAVAIFDQVPENALLLCNGNDVTIHATRYLQVCESYRPDVVLIDVHMAGYPWFARLVEEHYPDVVWPGDRYHGNREEHPDSFDVRDLIDANWNRRPVYLVGGYREGDFSPMEPDYPYATLPYGLVQRVYRKNAPPDFAQWAADNLASLEILDPVPLESFPDDSWEREIRRDYLGARHARAVAFIFHAIANDNHAPSLRQAVRLLEDIVSDPGEARDPWYKDLGIAYGRLTATDPAAAEGLVRAWSTYLERVPDAPDADRMRAALRPYLRQSQGR